MSAKLEELRGRLRGQHAYLLRLQKDRENMEYSIADAMMEAQHLGRLILAEERASAPGAQEPPILRVDEKWSIIYDPDNNDRPMEWLRYGEPNSTFQESNAVVSLFYAILGKSKLAQN